MTVEELLKPRWKVIADYPKSLYHVGDILNGGWRSEDLIYCDHDGPRWSHYPHLFKKLEWWEERKPEDMPQYLKDTVKGLGIIRADKIEVGKPNYPAFTYLISSDLKMGGTKYLRNYIPATEEEYNAHCQTSSQNGA